MENFAAPARPIVAAMAAAAAANPERAVAFQGAPGANSHVAALEVFPDGLPLPCFSFEDAIDAGKDGRAECAVIPIENSLHGRVADMHFLLPESGLVIVGEHFLPIRYALMGPKKDGAPMEGVAEAMSHPQALGQCRHWLKARGIVPTSYPDTAGAAALVAELADPKIVAHNTTRFVTLAREARPLTGDAPFMTTIIFEVKNVPAALYKAMGGFATNGVNMTKLESYQKGGSFAATDFFADVEGRPGDAGFDRALEELGFHSKWMRVLGTYPQARRRG